MLLFVHLASTTPARSSATTRSSARSCPTCTSSSTRCWPSAAPMPRSANPSGPTWDGPRWPRRATWKTPGSASCSGSGGQSWKASAFLLRLWRESPGGATVDSDFFGLAQRLAALAGRADGPVCAPLEAGGATRAGLLHQATRLTEIFLAESPDNPLADEAGLALVANAFELGDHAGMIRDRGAVRAAASPRARSATASATARHSASSTWASSTARSRWRGGSPSRPPRVPRASRPMPRPSPRRRSRCSAGSTRPGWSRPRPWRITDGSPAASPTPPRPSRPSRPNPCASRRSRWSGPRRSSPRPEAGPPCR